VELRRAALLVLAACSSKARAVEDARSAKPVPRDAAIEVPKGPYRTEAGAFAKGDVQIRVEWKDVPTVARASPGRTACGTPRPPAVTPTTTWGIPDAIVMIDVDHGVAMVDPQARVVLEHCGLSPRVALAGASVMVASAADAPAQLSFTRTQPARPLEVRPPDKTQPLAIQLPITGHEVSVPLAANAIYTLGYADESVAIIAPTTPYYGVTEATGQIVLRDVPVGTFAVAALIPARAGQPARAAKATVTVAANALAEVTVDVTP
jgi:hypothetical protein